MPESYQEQPFEAYADGFNIATGAYTVILEFNVLEFGQPITAMKEEGLPPERTREVLTKVSPEHLHRKVVARLRVSPQHAVVMAKVMYRHIKQYAQENKVELPEKVYQELNLERKWL